MSLGEGTLEEKAAIYTSKYGQTTLKISYSANSAKLIVFLGGSLDTESSTDFFTFLRSAKAELPQGCGVCVDLKSVRYLSSTGIGVLSSAMLEFTKERIPFTLRSVPPTVKSLFELLGVWNFFSVEPDGREADS